MRQHRWTIIIIALLLSACGATQQAEQPAGPATSLPTVPTAAPNALPATPTDDLFRAEPTAPLILPPSATSNAAQQAATSAPTDAPATAPTAPPAAQAEPSVPVRIEINGVDMNQKVVSVGLDKNRVPIVPNHDVGWYNLSGQPGQGENIVLWGHVLRFRQTPKIPAPFARLKEVKPGAKVVLYDQNGKAHSYVVKQQIWVKPDEVEYILPKGREMVTMVSCIGDKVITNGEVVDESHRLITIAEPEA
jgi:LPXTG-site transpeptidase (sortase) family protein